jgi:hypothetical protein
MQSGHLIQQVNGPLTNDRSAIGRATRLSPRRRRRGCDSLIGTKKSLILQNFSQFRFAGNCAQPVESATGIGALRRQNAEKIENTLIITLFAGKGG